MRQLRLALQEFRTENHFYPVNDDPAKGNDFILGRSWMGSLTSQLSLALNESNWESSIWYCPASPHRSSWPGGASFCSYGYNGFGMTTVGDENLLGLGGHKGTGKVPFVSPFSFGPPVNESEVANPSDMMAIGDGFVGSSLFIVDGEPWIQRLPVIGDFLGSTKRAHVRHQGKANVVFCDDHVESPSCNFCLKTPATRPWRAGTATICRTLKNCRRRFLDSYLNVNRFFPLHALPMLINGLQTVD